MERVKEEERKKKKVIVLAFLLCLIAIIGVYFLADTYAKYTNQITATGTGKVAKWKFETDNTSGDILFNLTETNIKPNTLAKSGGKYYIAPGTEGTIDIEVLNTSDVGIKVEVLIPEEFTGYVPLTFGVATGIKMTSTDIKKETVVDSGDNFTKYTFYLAAQDNTTHLKAETISIPWTWPYEAQSPRTDADDTTIGKSASDDSPLEFIVKMIGTQVDPNVTPTTPGFVEN